MAVNLYKLPSDGLLELSELQTSAILHVYLTHLRHFSSGAASDDDGLKAKAMKDLDRMVDRGDRATLQGLLDEAARMIANPVSASLSVGQASSSRGPLFAPRGGFHHHQGLTDSMSTTSGTALGRATVVMEAAKQHHESYGTTATSKSDADAEERTTFLPSKRAKCDGEGTKTLLKLKNKAKMSSQKVKPTVKPNPTKNKSGRPRTAIKCDACFRNKASEAICKQRGHLPAAAYACRRSHETGWVDVILDVAVRAGGIQAAAGGGGDAGSGGESAGFAGLGDVNDAMERRDGSGTDSAFDTSGSENDDAGGEEGDGVSGDGSGDGSESGHSDEGAWEGPRKRRRSGRPAHVEVDEERFLARCNEVPTPTNRQLQHEFGITYHRVQKLKRRHGCGQNYRETMAQDAERVRDITFDSLHSRWVREDAEGPVLHRMTVPAGVKVLAGELGVGVKKLRKRMNEVDFDPLHIYPLSHVETMVRTILETNGPGQIGARCMEAKLRLPPFNTVVRLSRIRQVLRRVDANYARRRKPEKDTPSDAHD